MRCTACGALYSLRTHSHLLDDELEDRMASIFSDRC
ncbi:hypothetical protein [Alkalidesulfovibrio alkalitolerans]|nr:hypothetical protein [Alkalidesulfovibrio alkalitolerans]